MHPAKRSGLEQPYPSEQLQRSKKHKVSHPNHPEEPLLPETFWDSLSQVWLSRNALRELDRRNIEFVQCELCQGPVQCQLRSAPEYLNSCTRQRLKNIQRFARIGGPDLSGLRGYDKPSSFMDQGPNPDAGTSISDASKPAADRTVPYDSNFEHHLVSHGIYLPRYRDLNRRRPLEPQNLKEILRRLDQPRPLSPGNLFDDFPDEVKSKVYSDCNKQNMSEFILLSFEGNLADINSVKPGIAWANLSPITNGTLLPANPDWYHGALPEQLDEKIRNELSGKVIPIQQAESPIVPNFFLAMKGANNSNQASIVQASYESALAARAIHSLQNYKQAHPSFDNKAYVISCGLRDGVLYLYTCHPSRPRSSRKTEYYMTQLGAIVLTDPSSFRKGITWYRNARDWAKERRDQAIKEANERAASNSKRVCGS